MDITYITLPQTLLIHECSIELFGGTRGIRDENLLKSALGRPKTLGMYVENIPTLAASYLESLLINHPFVDGNKRTAFCVMDVFLKLNGIILKEDNIPDETLYEMVIDIIQIPSNWRPKFILASLQAHYNF